VPQYKCKSCGKEMFSHTEFMERLSGTYCNECDPDRVTFPANETRAVKAPTSTNMKAGPSIQRFEQARERRRGIMEEDILALHQWGLISVTGTGNSITEIRASITSRTGVPLKVHIPHGTYFVSSGDWQNMVTRNEYDFDLDPWATKHISIAASCINAGCAIPQSNHTFKGVARVPEVLSKFLQAAAGEDAMTIQAGVWAITDDYSRDDIKRRLRKRWTSRGASAATSVSFDDGPAISDANIDRAKELLDRLLIPNRIDRLGARRWVPDFPY